MNMNLEDFLRKEPYSLNYEDKKKYLDMYLNSLNKHHYENCPEYKKILDGIDFDITKKVSSRKLPFLPVSLFKDFSLKSINETKINKTMNSSGTSGQEVSKIYLDKETSLNQTKALTRIVSDYIGSKRAPMIIIDSPSVLKNRNMFSARGAGILGFSMFASKKIYALDEEMKLDLETLKSFIDENKDSQIFIFGFTFMIFKHFIKEIIKSDIKLDLSKGVLIHGGGWKKLESESISSKKFKELLFENCRLEKVHDYYGMVEQTGSIYMECEEGHLHTSIFSDIIIRDPKDFSECNYGEEGIIQTLSVLPKSYPGFSLLTEDLGVLLGKDDCKCGRLGKYFKINGRIKNAEIRGCSDTYED